MAERILTRLFVEAALAGGTTVDLSPEHAHFLRSVLRAAPGAKLALFNGRDGEWLAELDAIGKKQASVMILEKRRDQTPSPALELAFAPVKKTPMDFLIQKSVELGVSALHPVLTERTQGDRINAGRLRAQTIEAAEQCERLDIPELHEASKLEAFLDGWPDTKPLFVCAEAGDATPLTEALMAQKSTDPAAGGQGLMTGPEGGFSSQELVNLSERPFVTLVGLGPRILRAETAALAALTLWQAIVGDLGLRPPHR